MKSLRQLILGSAAGLLSLLLVLGGFSMAFTEDGMVKAMFQTVTIIFTDTPTPTPPPSSIETSAPLPGYLFPSETPFLTGTATSLPTATLPAVAGNCLPPPEGWSRVEVQAGDTLSSLAQAYNTSLDNLRLVNCLQVDSLLPGSTMFVPGRPTQTSSVACGPPAGWVYYTVRPGDTLYRLSLMLSTTVSDLQKANCMGGQTTIRVGQKLFVPFLPNLTSSPTTTPTATLIPTSEPTWTSTMPSTPTNTPVWIPSSTSNFTPEPTDTPTSTETATLTLAPMVTETPTWSVTATETITLAVP